MEPQQQLLVEVSLKLRIYNYDHFSLTKDGVPKGLGRGRSLLRLDFSE